MPLRRYLPLVALLAALPLVQAAGASHTPAPTSVTVAGSLQSELGCPGDWQPECAATHLAYDANDDVWQASFAVPAGSWEYKAPLNDSWDENYGRGAVRDGPNIPLALGADATVKFYYDHKSHWITDNVNSTIAVAPGSFQSELGCSGDWDPACLRSWLQDLDGDGTYTLTTDGLPAGSYEAKVAIGESWDENYGQGGVRDGANIPFTVPAGGANVTFSYDAATHVPTITVAGLAPGHDGDIFFDGLGHDSRDTLYRVPGGAVPAGTSMLLRFRTFHEDATSVTLRTWQDGERLYEMERVATGVPCYDTSLAFGCDFWQATVEAARPGTLYYRFIVRDGPRTVNYEDDSEVRDGGWGRPYDVLRDWGWALTVYDPAFAEPVPWMRNGVVYQIFPDRFRNGNPSNDPVRGRPNQALPSDDPRYSYPNGDPSGASEPAWDQIWRLPWGTLPEGYCRNYQAAACPRRFPQPPGEGPEGPRGRDYFGGDLNGVIQKLPYLRNLGVSVLFFNPIFAAASNHRYDTRDYTTIDPYLGTQSDWRRLVEKADELGIRILLDGVFNHTSSDSPLFDRYHNFDDTGACESLASPFRSWYRFRPPVGIEPAACAPFTREGDSAYFSWAGFDSLPQLVENDPVREAVFGADDSYARRWLRQGADGWRLDVMQEKSIPFWESFRQRVRDVDPNAAIIGELWKKFDVLPFVHGNTADSAMNYRLRDAVIGLLAPGPFDAKGFPGSGSPISPTAFQGRLQSVREDYPDRAYFSLMNLLDSHDTERLLWTLTPGVENRDGRELDAANLTEGKQRQRLAALIQMTVPGAPTIYYGDEVGLTGDDDPDDRRTYPWGAEDDNMLAYYRGLTRLRARNAALRQAPLRFLLADDAAGTVAYGRKHQNDAVLVALNTSREERTLRVPVGGYLPDGTRLGDVTVSGGEAVVTLAGLRGVALEARDADLTPTAAPSGLTASAEGMRVVLGWNAVDGAAGYDVYRSPVTRGGYVKVNTAPLTATAFADEGAGLRSGQRYFYVVKALDSVGNPSTASNEASAVPSHTIGWANLQWPPTLDYTVSARFTTDPVFGQVWIDGVTNLPGPTPGLLAQLGFGRQASDPRSWDTWVDMEFNVDAGNNDEFEATLQPTVPGTFSYFTRYSTNAGESWTYGDLDGIGDGSFDQQTNSPGTLTVHANPDQTPPDAPANLQAAGAGATTIVLAWDAVSAPDLFRYDVYRSTTSGSGYAVVDSVPAGTTSFTDTGLVTGTRYYYVVRAVDDANNHSGPSNEASAIPQQRVISVTLAVTAPASTPAGATVYVAGNQPELCAWCNPHTVALTGGADGIWRVTIPFLEGTPLEYKYTLGSWDFVEKGASCEELANRQALVAGGSDPVQTIENTVLNWRNVAPCGS
jgi:glycosidase